jgi:hypothetical protein
MTTETAKHPSRPAIAKTDSLERQRTRLLRLYQLGEIEDEYLQKESSSLKAEGERLRSLLPSEPSERFVLPSEADLEEMCSRVRSWVKARGRDELPLIGRALQLSIQATKDRSEVKGIIPQYARDCEHADDYTGRQPNTSRPNNLRTPLVHSFALDYRSRATQPKGTTEGDLSAPVPSDGTRNRRLWRCQILISRVHQQHRRLQRRLPAPVPRLTR